MMKFIVAMSVSGFLIVIATGAHARNVMLMLPIAAALEAKDIPDRPTGAVKFFFADEPTPSIQSRIGSYVATPRTGAAGKTDLQGCNEAFLWTLVALEKRAQQAGANAVINIVSFYQKKEVSSAIQFECHVGNVIVRVPLKGELVKIVE